MRTSNPPEPPLVPQGAGLVLRLGQRTVTSKTMGADGIPAR
jgi:hypothetical protein